MTVTVPLYGSAISRDILYLLYYYTPPPPPSPVPPHRFFLGCSPRYANLPLYHISLAYSHEAAAGGGSGGGWIRAAAPTDAYERACIQAVSGRQVDTSGSNRCLGVIGIQAKPGRTIPFVENSTKFI
ncbi:hypothetical protein ALC62_14567 [Cyphomyrmex costatus]|uniref:Uncharacterized protein n=1 Tax=Cyphomyrmex costatus TaxID=456900 RepID=A0A195C2C0_9HYME|nr:hypothetical protein ALC62_14567 [Cyphomyrmex costatus]